MELFVLPLKRQTTNENDSPIAKCYNIAFLV